MTETHATTPTHPPVFPPGRYGRRRAPQRRRPWLVALLLVPVVVLGAAVMVRLYQQHGDPNYQAKVITYTEITDSQILVTFQVTVPPGGSADCMLRARSRDGAEVGLEKVRVTAAPGERTPVVSHRLATTARPLIGEVLRCRPIQ
ncbi:DUF4307 domain-containing protein [Micromonospora sp. NPDC049679]|uniref:DUF4307 domain-containing protein n=1 Tax=Micromonospora sp. NPDC049679 TaxID=3155920 RepID=UPI00340BAB5A